MKLKKANTGDYAESLEDFSPAYTPVKVWSLLQFYTLEGRKTTLILDNFVPIEDLKYCVYSPQEKRYYFKTYPEDVPLWLIMFYDPNGNWDSYDNFLNNLREKVADGNVHLLLTSEQIEEMRSMLVRMYKSHFSNEGKLPYKIFIQIMDESLRREDYYNHSSSLTGFRTVLRMYDERINELWKRAYKN